MRLQDLYMHNRDYLIGIEIAEVRGYWEVRARWASIIFKALVCALGAGKTAAGWSLIVALVRGIQAWLELVVLARWVRNGGR